MMRLLNDSEIWDLQKSTIADKRAAISTDSWEIAEHLKIITEISLPPTETLIYVKFRHFARKLPHLIMWIFLRRVTNWHALIEEEKEFKNPFVLRVIFHAKWARAICIWNQSRVTISRTFIDKTTSRNLMELLLNLNLKHGKVIEFKMTEGRLRSNSFILAACLIQWRNFEHFAASNGWRGKSGAKRFTQP